MAALVLLAAATQVELLPRGNEQIEPPFSYDRALEIAL